MELINITTKKDRETKTDVNLKNLKVHDSDTRIWLIDPTYTQQQISSESMPNAIGGISTYAEQLLELKNPIELFKYPEEMIKTIQEEGMPDILGFSNYIWNFQLSLSLIRIIKKIKPSIIIIMGGPNFPISSNEKEEFLQKYHEIDFYVAGEGEIAFTNLISLLIKSKLERKNLKSDIPSIQFIDVENNVHISEPIQRIGDLSEIPSPYTFKKLDKFFDGKLQPTVQTTRGCPFSCTFCVEGEQYYSKVNRNNFEKISSELEYIGKKMKEVRGKGGRNDLWLVDSNFGMYNQDIETCRIIANCQEKYGWPEYIQCDTGKNNKAKVLDAARLVKGAIRLSGAVQSLNKQVLTNIKRSNIDEESLMKMAVEAAEIDADSRSDIILGLPGESLKTHFETLKTVVNAGFSHVNTFQLMMLPGTELNDKKTRKQFGMETKFRVLPRCFGNYKIFEETAIAAEIEEICTNTDSLTFEDYLNCRKMHLLIHIYFNDGMFGTALKFLKFLGISVFRWIEIMFYEEMNEGVKVFFEKFQKDTKNELWDDKDELLKFIQTPGTVEKYISGELGYNLLFVHKAIAMDKDINDLKNFAFFTIKKLLKENLIDTKENLDFLLESLEFDLCSCKDIFHNQENISIAKFNYDIRKFQELENIENINNLKLSQPAKMKFIHNIEQKDIIERSINLYGNSYIGISRILTKVFVKKLLRKPIIISTVNSTKI